MLFYNNNNNQRQCLWCRHRDHGHCESSPGSFDECRLSVGWPSTLRPSQPTIKRFALYYPTVVLSVCLSVCLSVTFVHCGQTVGRIKTKFGMQVGLILGHIVLDGNPAPLPQRGTAPTQYSGHICCGQMAAWIKMPLGMELGLRPGEKRAETPPQF